jgi:hypothetical protein
MKKQRELLFLTEMDKEIRIKTLFVFHTKYRTEEKSLDRILIL